VNLRPSKQIFLPLNSKTLFIIVDVVQLKLYISHHVEVKILRFLVLFLHHHHHHYRQRQSKMFSKIIVRLNRRKVKLLVHQLNLMFHHPDAVKYRIKNHLHLHLHLHYSLMTTKKKMVKKNKKRNGRNY